MRTLSLVALIYAFTPFAFNPGRSGECEAGRASQLAFGVPIAPRALAFGVPIAPRALAFGVPIAPRSIA